jgi:hypothetical protein
LSWPGEPCSLDAAILGTYFRLVALIRSDMEHTRVYVGWGCRDPRALDVCLFSIQRHASDLVEIVSLKPRTVAALCGPDPDPNRTKQAQAAYLVPSLNGFSGWAAFVSSDMLFQADIYELWKHRDARYAVMGVPSTSTRDPRETLGSSLLLWNCGHPANRQLTPDRVATMDSEERGGFEWLQRSMIGVLPAAWCWREGMSDPKLPPKAIEFGNRKPWVGESEICRYADRWQDEATRIFGSLASSIGSTATA